MKQIFNLKQLWIISLILFLLPTFALSTSWHNSSYRHRINFYINSTGDDSSHHYYALVNLTHQTDMESDFSDILFVNNNDTLDFEFSTIELNDYAEIFIETAYDLNSSDYYVYFGSTITDQNTTICETIEDNTCYLMVDDFEDGSISDWVDIVGGYTSCEIESTEKHLGSYSIEINCNGVVVGQCIKYFPLQDDDITIHMNYWQKEQSSAKHSKIEGLRNSTNTTAISLMSDTTTTRKLYNQGSSLSSVAHNTWKEEDLIVDLENDKAKWFESNVLKEDNINLVDSTNFTDLNQIILVAGNDLDSYVDDIKLSRYIDGSVLYEFDSIEDPDLGITINAPLNTTYYDTDITLNFTVLDDTLTNINTWYTIDGTETYYNATNNTDEIINLTVTSEGIHYVNITSENSDYNRSNIVYFTTNFYDLESDGFTEDVYLSGEQWYYFQYIRYYVTSATGWNNYLTLNSTNYTLSLFSSNATHYIYYATDNFAEITTDEELYYNSTLSNSYVNETSATRSIELFTFNLDDCSVYTVPTINFYGYDELTDILSNFTLNGVFVVSSSEDSTTSQTFNFSLSGNNTHALCLKENNVTYNLNAELEYYNATSEVRNYYLIDVNLTSTPQSVNLYLIPSTTDSKQILMTVQNENGVIESDVIIYLNKFSYETNSYKTVAMAKSDDLGQAVSYIYAPDNTYQFILIQEGVTVNTYDSIIPIPDATTDVIDILLQTSPSSFGEFWDYYDSITGNCEFNNSTKLMTCTYADTSGILQNVYLDVIKKTLLDETTVCNEYLSSASGTLTCDLGSNSTREYFYSLITEFQQTNYTLQSGIIVVDVPTNYNDVGYMSAFIFIGVLATAVLISEIMVLLTFIGLALMSYGNLIYVSTETLVGLAITTIILIAIMRNKK